MSGAQHPNATTIAPLVLPRARALTDALIDPGTAFITPQEGRELRLQLARALERIDVRSPAPAPCLRIGAYHLASALGGVGVTGAGRFHWSARTSRRGIGLAAVRSLVEGRARTPAGAVASVVADPSGAGGLGRGGPGSCVDWLASLSPPARAAVSAEATTWATRLWTALEWERLEPVSVGPPDRWCEPTGSGRVALRGRADVRVGASGRPTATLQVLTGLPRPTSQVELALSALVSVVARPDHAPPSRVVGWWPDCGRAWAVPVSAASLEAAIDAIARAAVVLSRSSRALAA